MLKADKLKDKQYIVKALARMYYAYLNKDEDNPHDFEYKAITTAKYIISEYGGLEKLLKEEL